MIRNKATWVAAILLVGGMLSGSVLAGNCGGSVEITAVGQTSGTMNLDVAMNNSSPFPQKTYVVLHVLMDRQSLQFVVSLVVPGASAVDVQFGFPTTIQPIEVDACGDKPTGIAESSDPVAVKVVTGEEEEESE